MKSLVEPALEKRSTVMGNAGSMLESYPKNLGDVETTALVACIEACTECAQICTACADACLGEDTVAELTSCIRIDLDCADLCAATARILSRQTGNNATVTKAVVEACATACQVCGDECARHGSHHEHCRICAEACRACEQACRDLLAALG
jgi:hypothetical protein